MAKALDPIAAKEVDRHALDGADVDEVASRLRVGEILVDTKGVSRLYPPGPSRRLMLVIVLAALITLVIVVLSSPAMERLLELLWLKLQVLFEGT